MLAGIIGDDEPGRMLGDILDAAGVDCRFEYLDGLPTITKLRVVSRHQQLIRLDFEDDFPAAGSELLLEACRAVIEEVDLLLLSDYAKGTLQDIQGLIELARQHGKPVLVDPKQQDFSLYRGATLLTPNLAEFESVVGPCRDQEEIVSKGQALIRQHDLQALLITRGEQGSYNFV